MRILNDQSTLELKRSKLNKQNPNQHNNKITSSKQVSSATKVKQVLISCTNTYVEYFQIIQLKNYPTCKAYLLLNVYNHQKSKSYTQITGSTRPVVLCESTQTKSNHNALSSYI